VYYACRTHSTTGLCTRHSIRHDRLEDTVLAAIQRQIDLIDDLAGMIDSINAAPAQRAQSAQPERAVKARHAALEKTQTLYDGLYADWKSENISLEAYQRMKQKCEEKEAALKRDIAKLEEEIRLAAQGTASRNPAFEAFRGSTLTELSRGIVAELIREIRIHEGGGVDIDFVFRAAFSRDS